MRVSRITKMKYLLLSFIILTIPIANLQSCSKNGEKVIPPVGIGETYNLKIEDLTIRDPFIFVDQIEKEYFLHAKAGKKIVVYKSEDLVYWKLLGDSFVPPANFWGKNDFWAPDLYKYNGKYYLFVTFSSSTKKRGTSILISDNPEGPFEPLVNRAITPNKWMCLDGALFIDNNDEPWIMYCHEWIEAIDGEIIVQKLSNNLKQTVGDPVVLFNASDAPWVGTISKNEITGYVTDAPFIYKLPNDELIMLWSSFGKDGKYAIGCAHSESGSVMGPWIQTDKPLNKDKGGGGHAMLFKDLNNRIMISYHSPNKHPSRPLIKRVSIENGKLTF